MRSAQPAMAAASYGYTAYGLHITSSIPLAEFIVARPRPADVTVRFSNNEDGRWDRPPCSSDFLLEFEEHEARFWFQGVGSFIVRGGREIILVPEGECDLSLLRLYVQGVIMATILYQRGMSVLHASVIEIDGKAIACIGQIGAGKSSTAAALYVRGHRILTDDNAAILLTHNGPMVIPGYPSVKLYPAIAASLGFEERSLGVLHQTQVKVVGTVGTGFSSEPLPLRAIYILDRDHAPEITRLCILDATVRLLTNAVPLRWGHRGSARQLKDCAAITKQVPAFAVRAFRELPDLQDLADQLETHQRVLSAELESTADPALEFSTS